MWRLIVVVALAGCGVAPVKSSDCAGCHVEVAQRFEGSRHATASQGPVFLAMRARATAQQQTFCDGCHTPGHGVTCLDCHGAVGNESTMNGLLRRGEVVGATTVSSRAPHQVEARPFLASSQLCGTCHEVHGPGAFQETPLTEWSDAGAVKTCAECHLGQHRFEVVLAGAVELSVRRIDAQHVEVSACSLVQGHAFPSGARFAHEAWVEIAADGVTQRFDLSDELDAVNPLEVKQVTVRALQPGELRRWLVPATGSVEAHARYRRYRPELLASLGLSEVDSPVIEVAQVRE
jgi:hypothetical protein